MSNEIQLTGDHNIVLQDISGSDVHIVVQDGLAPEVKAKKTELKEKVQALTAQLDQQLAQLPLPGSPPALPADLQKEVAYTLKALKTGRCVLFLGPDIALDRPDASPCLHEQQYAALMGENPELIYNPAEGFFEPHEDPFFELNQHQFYSEDFPQRNVIGQAILYHLSQLPFKLIVNFSPDESLRQLWERYDKDHQFAHYQPGKELPDLAPDADQPLLLNVLGSAVSDAGRFIYTHADFYRYLSKVRLPSQVKSEIQQAVHFLFVGFDFRRWYTRLLLFMLELHDKKKLRHLQINPFLFEEEIKRFLEAQFSLSSVEHDYLGFAQALSGQARSQQMATDLQRFFLKKQLFKLQALAAQITDARELVPLHQRQSELATITQKLARHA